MKIFHKNNTDLTTNFKSDESNSHEFSIGDVSTIIEILRNKLYSNPIRTLTQEYLSNARDSHRECNQEKPITVTLPTKIESCLKIRDYGVGLSKERVKDVFVNYGISTKRSDNVQTGGFGLGAKSAWAYTDSFVVVSYYEGVCSTYIAHTGKNKNGTFELINEVPTTEENGVEIQIPVQDEDIEKFKNAVYRTTFFWDTKPELKGISNMEIPKEYSNSNVFQFKNIYYANKTPFLTELFSCQWSKTFVLIDKIPYDISKFSYTSSNLNLLSNITNDNKVCFIGVENGDIDVSASREEVDTNSSSKIDTFSKSAVAEISVFIQDSLQQKHSSFKNYVRTYNNLRSIFDFSKLPNSKELRLKYSTEDGVEFNFNLVGDFSCNKFIEISKFDIRHRSGKEVVRIRPANYIPTNKKIVIEDKEFSDILRKRKAKKIIADDNDCAYFVCVDPEFVNSFSSIDPVYLSTIVHDKISTNKSNKEDDEVTVRILSTDNRSRTYKVEVSEKYNMKLSEVESSDKSFVVVPFSKEEKYNYENDSFYQMVRFLRQKGFIVTKCSKKDYEKIINSDCENVMTYDYVCDNIEDVVSIDNKQIELFFHSRSSSFSFNVLKKYVDKINCSSIKEVIDHYDSKETTRREYFSEFILSKYSHFKVAKEKFEAISSLEESILRKYPLLKKCGRYDEEEILLEYVEYINAKN